MKEKMKTILLIEDNAADAMFIDELLQGSGCACELKRCERLSQAFALADAQSFDAVLLDLGLPDSIGIETLSRLQERMPDVPVVVLTGMSDQEVAASAISLGAQDYLVKGRIEREVLVRSILYSIERKRIETSMREQKDLSEALNRLDSLIHSTLDFDAVLQQLLQQASEAMGVEASSLGLFHNNKYVIKCVHNLSSELVGSPVPIGEMKGVLHTARVRDVVAFNNAQEDGRLNNETYAALGIRSMMIAPFIVKGLVLGAMSFFSLSRIFQFTGTHLDFARRLAASVSSAFDNARLYDALRKSERLSRSRLSQLEAIYASAPVGLCFIDSDLRYVNINERLAEINGLPAEEHVGRTVRDVTPNMADRVEPYLRQALQNGKAVENQEIQGLLPSGKPNKRFWLTSFYPVRDPSGNIAGVNVVLQEITGRKKMEEEIRHLANHDALTGLPNRRLFLELIRLERSEARRHGKKLAVFFLDLDRFKVVNDTLGHSAGDQMLKQVAAGLRASIRASDTLARIGGDEFNILVSDINAAQDAADVARKIACYFQRPVFLEGHEFTITASIGISIFPDDSTEIEDLLQYADTAMYLAKEQGRNNFQFYNPEITIRSMERIRLEKWLSQAIRRDELFLHYQPQVDIKTKKIVCAEALLRWRHPEMGTIDPGRFIPVAEESGLITSIDQWVLGSACSQMKTWLDSGIPSVCITVNLSARLFENADLVRIVSRALEETGLPADRLDLEITETMAMSNVERTASRLKELAAMGVHISIDDFGTGYSSLSYLKRLPIKRLKIDRSFVKDITTDPDDRNIISAVTAMAHNMKMRVIAEGVETEEQLSFLNMTDCDEMQGFLFSKPLPADEFKELMTSGR